MRCIMSGSIGCVWRGAGFQAAIAVALLCAVQAGAQTPTVWTNTSGGTWSNSTCWDNGVPSNNNTFITATGASYTVTYDAPANSFSNLTISNSAGYTSTLTITSTAFAPAGNVLLSSGAVVNVNSGGVWDTTLNNFVWLDVKAGAALNVAGGSLIYTNVMTNDVSMILSDSNAGGTSVLNLTSGRIELYTATNSSSSTTNLLIGGIAGKSGIMNISGGKCTIQSGGHNSTIHIGSGAGSRGSLNLSGGELVITNSPTNTPFVPVVEGPYIHIGYNGGYGELNISGDGKFTKVNNKELWIGYSGEGHFNINGGTVTNNGTFLVGCRGINGTGTVTITAGELQLGSLLNLAVEGYSGNKDETGILNIYGGTTTVASVIYAGYSYGFGLTNRIGRITVTNGLLYAKSYIYVGLMGSSTGKANGEINISGSGIITNYGPLYVGQGTGAVGIVNQSGGRYHLINTQIGAIGDRGGNGTYNLSNGWAYFKSYLYVGGTTGSNSVGVLKINGGSLETEDTLYIGEKGTGTLNMAGSQGALTVPSLTATTRTSRIRFDLGPASAGTVTVSGAVSIGTNANLTITVTNYDWLANGLTVDLISYGTLTGTFGTNVTLVGAAGGLDGGTILYDSGTIRLQLTRRPSGVLFHMSRRKLLPFIALAHLRRIFELGPEERGDLFCSRGR